MTTLATGHRCACCAMVNLPHAFLLPAQATDLGRRTVDVPGLVWGSICRKQYMKTTWRAYNFHQLRTSMKNFAACMCSLWSGLWLLHPYRLTRSAGERRFLTSFFWPCSIAWVGRTRTGRALRRLEAEAKERRHDGKLNPQKIQIMTPFWINYNDLTSWRD